jgi:hypothetical protein
VVSIILLSLFSISIVFYYFIQLSRYTFRSYDHLQAEIYTCTSNINTTENRSVFSRIDFLCIYFHRKMVVRPKHVAAKFNKIVKKLLK